MLIRLLILVATLFGTAASAAPQIAAASDLKFALDEVARSYATETGATVNIAYGSSGNFARQISQGAPFQLFLSADESYVIDLVKTGHAINDGVLYAVGRIVLFAPHGSPLVPDENFQSLAELVVQGKLGKLAIANPDHAPYGRAAREALIKLGLWTKVQPQLILGENVSQAAQFATTSGSSGGILAYSLALAPAVALQGRYVLLPAALHAPLRQRMALIKNATPEARAFYAYLQQTPARNIFKRYGFVLPDQ